MIVPTTILSLAALSAAESNSSGKRGLRKSSTPWTAIAVVSGTALTAGAIGGLLGHFLTAGGGAEHKYPEGVYLYNRGEGCEADYYQTGKGPVAVEGVFPADERSCSPCASDKFVATREFVADPTECAPRECVTGSGNGTNLTGSKTCKCGSDAHCSVDTPVCATTLSDGVSAGTCTAPACVAGFNQSDRGDGSGPLRHGYTTCKCGSDATTAASCTTATPFCTLSGAGACTESR